MWGDHTRKASDHIFLVEQPWTGRQVDMCQVTHLDDLAIHVRLVQAAWATAVAARRVAQWEEAVRTMLSGGSGLQQNEKDRTCQHFLCFMHFSRRTTRQQLCTTIDLQASCCRGPRF